MVRNPTQQIASRQNADEASMGVQDWNCMNALVQHEAGNVSDIGGYRTFMQILNPLSTIVLQPVALTGKTGVAYVS